MAGACLLYVEQDAAYPEAIEDTTWGMELWPGEEK